jgi:hypothetical protein
MLGNKAEQEAVPRIIPLEAVYARGRVMCSLIDSISEIDSRWSSWSQRDRVRNNARQNAELRNCAQQES